ncbi:PiggyBac transposase uribo2 [Plakobranchus ocellatus]|uniref:PiggyBac transposase uribo2 n=1 Tax=Plakobranchus ocellatus TaxID=259542 RepID=A0AAV4DHV9_9GAST|nr:PiggyBac transposase uribo2 [Plakobranchus ocellatus]
MPRKRFEQIQTFLHLNDNSVARDRNSPGADRLFKIRPLVDHIQRKCDLLYYPGQNLPVDESMMPWNAGLQFKQYIPSKPYTYGIKMYCLCDAENGYVSKFKIYTGKEGNRADKDHGANVVRKLSQEFHGKGHCVYMDNFFSSIPLFEELKTKGTLACGILRSNRKGIPYNIRSKKLKKGESDFRRKGDLMCMKYHDKNEVYLLSTAHSSRNINTGKINRRTQEPIVKPEVVAAYNNYMKGVNQFDQNLMYYNFNKKACQVVETSSPTSLPYDESTSIHHISFDEILEEIVLLNPLPPAGDGQRLTGRDMHYLTPIPPTKKRRNPTKNCKVCTILSNDERPGAKRYIHRRESRYQCLQCGGIPLCVHPCHKLYNTVQDFRRSILRQLNLNNTVD